MKIKELDELRVRLQADMATFNGAWITHGIRMIGSPPPFPDEAFSSWCERLSFQFGVGRELILERLGIQTPASWVDAGWTRLDVSNAAYLTGISPERLAVFNAATNTLIREPQYAYLTSSPLEQRTTFRYCERCFKEDKVPYGRRLWRLSLAHICPKHRTILRDKCPNCSRRIDNEYFFKRRIMSLRTCGRCEYDLGAAKSRFLPVRESLIMLRRQAWWVKLLSALDSFQNGPDYWYGNFDPDWVHRAIGQLRGLPDAPFLDFLIRFTGDCRFPVGKQLIIRKPLLEDMLEADNPYFERPKDLRPEETPWLRTYVSGAYSTLRGAHAIAKVLSECHDLPLRGDLWHRQRDDFVPGNLTKYIGDTAYVVYEWLYPLCPGRWPA
jgi:hypothetical protein